MTDLCFLEKNLEALEKYNPYCFKWLTAQGADSKAISRNLIRNRDGLLDWPLTSNKGLFDDIPPDKAYGQWVCEERADTSATIIVGCNIGYGVNHVLSNMPESHKVIVLEPRPEMLVACLGQTDYRRFLQAKRLFFFPPDRSFLRKAVCHLDLHYLFGSIRILADLPSCQLGPEYARWTDAWKAILEDLSCDLNTMRLKQDVMIENELENFLRAMQDGCLLPLKGRAENIDAVLLGAGPSLERFAPLLAENPGNALYTCGLQTLPVLQRYGLKPHLCMAIDYTTAMKRVYDRLDRKWAEDIPFIYSCKVDPEVVRAYPGPTLPLWTTGGLGTHIPRTRELVLSTGKGVGVTLVRFLFWCGIDRLLLVGNDFAWPGDKTHAEGHLSDKNGFRFNPKRHEKLKNRQGKTIYSTLAYITALRELELELEASNIPVSNLYGGGMTIKGSKEITWKQVLADNLLDSACGSVECFVNAINRARSPRPWPGFEARSSSWAKSLRSVEKRLRRLFKKAWKHQEEIHSVLSQILAFFRQDPLYLPCLYNEIFDLAGLVHARSAYGLKEWAECKAILKQVAKKVREVDYHLVYKRKAA